MQIQFTVDHLRELVLSGDEWLYSYVEYFAGQTELDEHEAAYLCMEMILSSLVHTSVNMHKFEESQKMLNMFADLIIDARQ